MIAPVSVITLWLLFVLSVVMGAKDYYEMFGLSRTNFDKSQLKKAYKKLALKYHPDKNPDNPAAQEELMKITAAYDVLNNDEKRRVYDRYGEEGVKQGAGASDFNPDDIFEQFFGRGFRSGHGGGFHFHQQPRRTPDSNVELKVSLKDVYTGTRLTVSLHRTRICSKCNGVGADRPEDIKQCPECHGHGVKVFLQQLGFGIVQKVQKTCEKCGGRGSVFKSVCSKCKGQKAVREEEPLTIDIEPGCPDGQVLKIKGMADQSPGLETGDLNVIIRMDPNINSAFKRDGPHLYTEIVIGLQEALLGFNKTIKHLDGHSVNLTQTTVTQPRTIFTFMFSLLHQHKPQCRSSIDGKGRGNARL